jgi:hypothetical protein
MGAPSKPYQYANTGNYPAGANPWSGQPTRVLPGTAYLTPNTKVPAQNLNYVMGQNSDAVGALWTYLVSLPAQNWSLAQTPAGSTDHWSAFCYNTFSNTWIAATRTESGGHNYLFNANAVGPLGATWTQTLTRSSANTAVGAIVPTNAAQFVTADCPYSGSSISVRLADISAATWNQIQSLTANGSGDTVSIQVIGAYYVLIGGQAIYSTTTPTTSSWTARTMPSGTTSASEYKAACSGSVYVAIPANINGQQKYIRSTDGIAFTAVTQATVGGSDQLGAVAYGPGTSGNGLFMFCVLRSTGVNDFFQSSDGSTWVHRGQIDGTSVGIIPPGLTAHMLCTDLHAFGAMWVATLESTDRESRMAFSLDDGVSWQIMPVEFTDNVTYAGTSYRYPGMVDDGCSLIAFNAKEAVFSLKTGTPNTLT